MIEPFSIADFMKGAGSIIGSIRNDILSGSDGTDTISGSAGTDIILGGGAENEAIVVQEYEDALEKITQAKQKYAKKYDISEAENQTNIAYITKSFQKLNTPNNPEKQADWDKIMTMAKIFAKDVQRDPNLSERDAGDIIEKFEQNVINLKHIGYKDTPDIYDLRECQTIFDDSFDINACTIDGNPTSDSEFKKGIFLGAVLPLILFTMPTIFLNIVVPGNKGKLEMLARGKKPPRKNPRISVH